MAQGMLYKKEDYKALGIHWVDKFLKQHPCLMKKFSQPLDKERALTHCLPARINAWFNLYRFTIETYKIFQEDIYNMDEKGFAMSVAGRVKVICPKDVLSTGLSKYYRYGVARSLEHARIGCCEQCEQTYNAHSDRSEHCD